MKRYIFWLVAVPLTFFTLLPIEVDARSNRHKGDVVIKGRKHWECSNLRKVYVEVKEGSPVLVTVEAGHGNAKLRVTQMEVKVGQSRKVKFPFTPQNQHRFRVIIKEIGNSDGGATLVYAHIERH